jgi:hypothetical protein
LNEKNIIFQLIFKLGIPVFVIAKFLKTNETEIYEYLNGKRIPTEAEAKLKELWLDLIDMQRKLQKIK